MSIKITEKRNVKSQNKENTIFDLEINHPQYGWIEYALRPDDPDNTINNDDLLVLIGNNYTKITQEELDAREAAIVRDQRNQLLFFDVDPIVSNPLRWADLTTEKQDAWKNYRTELLNVPQQKGFPYDVTFPTKPS